MQVALASLLACLTSLAAIDPAAAQTILKLDPYGDDWDVTLDLTHGRGWLSPAAR
jgi:hypothetical protein